MPGPTGRDVEIISHHATRDRLVSYFADLPAELPAQVASYAERLEGAEDAAERVRIGNLLRYGRDLLARIERGERTPLTTLTFDRKVVLHRGPLVEVYFLGRGHTDGDAILFLSEQRVAFLGDLLWTRVLPNVKDGFTREWIATLKQVLALGAERFVPGHGAFATASDVRDQIAYLMWLREAVEPWVVEGKSVDEAKAGIALPRRLRLSLAPGEQRREGLRGARAGTLRSAAATHPAKRHQRIRS